MNKHQRSKFYMGNRVIAYVETVPVATQNLMPSFPGCFLAVKSIMGVILGFLQVQDEFLSAFSASKRKIRTDLTEDALTLAAILQSYATAADDAVLYERMDINKTFIKRLSSVRFSGICNTIGRLANEHIGDLAAYDVTVAYMADYSAQIQSYEDASATPENALLSQKEATREIEANLVAMDSLLERMDGSVFIIRKAQRLFYESFKDARKLLKAPKYLLSARGTITDAQGRPIPFAKISCKGLGIERKATKNGGFRMKNAKEGIWVVVFSQPGYKTVTVTVTISYGKRTEINVVMELEEVVGVEVEN